MLRFFGKLCAVLFLLLSIGHALAGEPVMEDERFTRHYMAALTTAMPEATMTLVAPLRLTVTVNTGKVVQVFLENPFSDYCRDRDALDDIVQTHIASLIDAVARFAAKGDAIDLDVVLPMIRGRDWLDARLTQLRSAGATRDVETFHEPLAEHLVLVYAMDLPTTLQYLRHIDLEKLHLAPEVLRARAMANLAQRVSEFKIHTLLGGNAAMLETGNDLESSLLLFDRLWTHEALQFGGDVVIAVPARGKLLVTGSTNAAGLAQVREMAADIIADNPYGVSDVLFVRRGGRFEMFD